MSQLYTAHQRDLHGRSHTLTHQLHPYEEKRMPYYLSPATAALLQKGLTIPAPSLFKSVSEQSESLPTVAECATHLVLLHAINSLRREILDSKPLDKVLAIEPRKQTVVRTPRGEPAKELVVRDQSFATRRKAKWSFYLNLAAARFLVWIGKLDASLAGTNDRNGILELESCPPLDALLVWHSALLNPSWFRKLCQQKELTYVRRLAFPWTKIAGVVNTENWRFQLSPEDSQRFQDLTNHDADLLQYLLDSKPEPVAHMLQLYGQDEEINNLYKTNLTQLVDADTLESSHKTFLESYHSTLDPSPGLTYLTAAVERQLAFVDKMVDFLWIRSPAVGGTLHRAINRYDHFLQLLKLCPGTTLVPTLDIDLVWHTNQCSAAAYENDMMGRVGRFMNHDDTISQPVLDAQSDHTGVLFQQYFGIEYRACLCWECEAIRSAVEDVEADIETVDFQVVSSQTVETVLLYRAMEIKRRAGTPDPQYSLK